MRKLYLLTFTIFLIGLQLLKAGTSHASYSLTFFTVSDTTKSKNNKITDTRKNKPAYLQKGVGIKVVPFKPTPAKTFNTPSKNLISDPDKLVSNLKVFPNPVGEQLNLSYLVSKDSNVTIKIMDVLGNEVTTLLSQRLFAGEQTNSFNISSKVNSGFYFVRLIVGSETIVKRISVL
ncbi:MAG TPA: T9SS type A sorting domain-containing protein [Sphingobacteriaceae bacterium]|nr:T9SS type A sorting domain-containing protein [Sphingobacteriaceae bacterium]